MFFKNKKKDNKSWWIIYENNYWNKIVIYECNYRDKINIKICSIKYFTSFIDYRW